MNRFYNLLPHGGGKQEPKRIVVHAMAEYIKYGEDVLHAYDFLKVVGLSAHSLITPSGVNIRCRKDGQIAYHAKGYNVDSLGIEFLVPGVHDYESFLDEMENDYLTPVQYKAGLIQIGEWLETHDIQHVDRHGDLDPARKSDPGAGFLWRRLLKDIGRD